MARKKSGNKQPEKLPFGKVTWVLNNLSAEELADMDTRDWDGDYIMSAVQRMVEQLWSLSAKWDFYSETVQITAMMNYKNQPNAGMAFSGRSDDLLDAYRIIVYKFYVVADGNLSEFAVSEKNVRG